MKGIEQKRLGNESRTQGKHVCRQRKRSRKSIRKGIELHNLSVSYNCDFILSAMPSDMSLFARYYQILSTTKVFRRSSEKKRIYRLHSTLIRNYFQCEIVEIRLFFLSPSMQCCAADTLPTNVNLQIEKNQKKKWHTCDEHEFAAIIFN